MIQQTTKIRRFLQPATLTCGLEISSVGSGLTQTYNTIDRVFIPDRTLSPLTITPVVTASAVDGSLGDTPININADCTYQWLYKDPYIWRELSSSEYYVENEKVDYKGRLIYTGNINAGSEMFLKVRVTYNDKRLYNTNVVIESEVLRLSTTAFSNIEQRLMITGETNILVNPFANPVKGTVNGDTELVPSSFIKKLNIKFLYGNEVRSALPSGAMLRLVKKDGDEVDVENLGHGLTAVYDFEKWATDKQALYNGEKSVVSGITYNNVDKVIGIQNKTWNLNPNYHGLFTLSSGSRRLSIILPLSTPINYQCRIIIYKTTGADITSVTDVFSCETGKIEYCTISSESVDCVLVPSSNAVVLLVNRYYVIKKIVLEQLPNSLLKLNDGYGLIPTLDTSMRCEWERSPILSFAEGTEGYDLILDCGACHEAAFDLILTDVTGDKKMDVREVSFQRAFPIPEIKIISNHAVDDNTRLFPQECLVTCNGLLLLHPDNYFDINWYAIRSSAASPVPNNFVGSGSKINIRSTAIKESTQIFVGVEVSQKNMLKEFYYSGSVEHPSYQPEEVTL